MPPKLENSLKAKLEKMPQKAGIYFFKDKKDRIIYIGKARFLKDRVRSYFLPTSDLKIKNILLETSDIDFILTGSEREAAFLENNFIRQHKPKYNIRLKDDKSFPYLKIDLEERYPGIYLTRRVEHDGARYFGPFSPAHRARTTIHIITKYFGLKSCEETIPGKRKRPCLEYDLKLCSAPCTGYISETEYKENVNNSLLFLEGKVDELLKILKKRMNESADRQEFEQAAQWRDLISTLGQIKEKPKLISVKGEDKDIFGYARVKEEISVHIFMMRNGRVIKSQSSFLSKKREITDREALVDYLLDFYGGGMDVPDQILLPYLPARQKEISKKLSQGRRKKVNILVPSRGKNRSLIDLANRNAASSLEKKHAESPASMELKKILGLKSAPGRIEGFDISNIGGRESVGSLVVFDNGKLQKYDYRKYKIKTVEGPNDIASLQEVLRRRYTKLQKEKGALPDLILVDGGKGQLNAARKVLVELGLTRLPVISLAKREEILFAASHKDGLRLDRSSPGLKLIQMVRDEAHRFALAFHRQRRKKTTFDSPLDNIPGIGKKRKAALLSKYQSIEEIKNTPQNELSRLIGIKAARELLKKRESLP